MSARPRAARSARNAGSSRRRANASASSRGSSRGHDDADALDGLGRARGVEHDHRRAERHRLEHGQARVRLVLRRVRERDARLGRAPQPLVAHPAGELERRRRARPRGERCALAAARAHRPRTSRSPAPAVAPRRTRSVLSRGSPEARWKTYGGSSGGRGSDSRNAGSIPGSTTSASTPCVRAQPRRRRPGPRCDAARPAQRAPEREVEHDVLCVAASLRSARCAERAQAVRGRLEHVHEHRRAVERDELAHGEQEVGAGRRRRLAGASQLPLRAPTAAPPCGRARPERASEPSPLRRA